MSGATVAAAICGIFGMFMVARAGLRESGVPRQTGLRKLKGSHGHGAGGMDVREDGIVGANDFGVRRHSHVRLEILGGITGRIGDVETKRERNAGAERLPLSRCQMMWAPSGRAKSAALAGAAETIL